MENAAVRDGRRRRDEMQINRKDSILASLKCLFHVTVCLNLGKLLVSDWK